MKIKFDITPTEFIIIKDILKKYLTKDCKAYVFGSRAKSSSLHGSDLDLALECKEKIEFKKLSKIKIDFEDSRLPYMVDVIDLQAVKGYFRDMIQNEMIEFPLGRLERVPELRFKEFSGEWEEKRLGEILTFKNGINASKEQYGYGYKFINVLDIINNTSIKYDDIIGSVSVSKEVFEKNKVEYGNILFQRSSEIRKEAGQTSVYLDKNIPATFGGFVIRGQQKEDYVSEFMNYMFKTQHARKEITQKSNGSTRYNVGQETLSNVKIFYPNKPEQQKIASFLTTIDTKIKQLTKKVELQEQYKKGVMQKIFSVEIRFKNDDGSEFPEWEEKRFNTFLKIPENIKPNRINKEKLLTVKLHLNGIKQAQNTDSLSLGATYYLRRQGQFIYGKQNIFNGAFGIVPKEFNNFLSSNDIPTLEINSQIVNKDFFIFYLSRKDYYRRLEALASGTGSKRIHENILLGLKINLPSLPEQTKIANFLSTLDKQIDTTKEQLAKIKEFKKGLLQRMFV